jgi:hypothetical protein
MKNEGPLLWKGFGNCRFCQIQNNSQEAEFRHIWTSYRKQIRLHTAHTGRLSFERRSNANLLQAKQSTLNKTAEVQKFGEYIQIAKTVLKYLFTE